MDYEPLSLKSPMTAAEIRLRMGRFLVQQIRSGAWAVGHQVSPALALAKQFETSFSNANLVLKKLEEAGILRRDRPRGTFVSSMPRQTADELLGSPRSRFSRVHVLMPGVAEKMPMHWNQSTLSQIEGVLNEGKVQLEYLETVARPTPAQFAKAVALLKGQHSDGLIILVSLLPGRMTSIDQDDYLEPYVEALLDYPGRVCLLNRTGLPLHEWPYDAVSLSPLSEGIAVGHYLDEQGVTDIISMSYSHAVWSRKRQAGMLMALKKAGTPVKVQTYVTGSLEEGIEVAGRVLDSLKAVANRPTFVVPNDLFAAQFLDMAQARGLSCPRDFCLVSFDNDERYRAYNITTVAPPIGQIGESMGQLLGAIGRRPSNSNLHVVLKSVMIERSTFTSVSPA